MSVITVETDRTSRELRAKLDHDFPELDLTGLYAERDQVASHYMIYAVKPLTPGSTRSAAADAIRARRRQLLGLLWLHLDALCEQRSRS